MEMEESKRHQLLQAVRILSTILHFSEEQFDFSSEEGKEFIKEGRDACTALEAEIQTLFSENRFY